MKSTQPQQLNYPVDAAPTAEVVSAAILRDAVTMRDLSGKTQLDSVKTPGVKMRLHWAGLHVTNKDGVSVIIPYSNVKSITPA